MDAVAAEELVEELSERPRAHVETVPPAYRTYLGRIWRHLGRFSLEEKRLTELGLRVLSRSGTEDAPITVAAYGDGVIEPQTCHGIQIRRR
jgi:hypothetical protein